MSVQQAANATAASAGNLGTAVDRMSFAHDIVAMTDEAIAIGLGVDIHVSLNTVSSFRFKFINLLTKSTGSRHAIQRSAARTNFND